MDVFTSTNGVRVSTAQAATDCDLFMLPKLAVEGIMANYTAEPRKRGLLCEVLKRRQQKQRQQEQLTVIESRQQAVVRAGGRHSRSVSVSAGAVAGM